jgi:hypothetical protein
LVDSSPLCPTDMTFHVRHVDLTSHTSPSFPQPCPLPFEETCSAHPEQAFVVVMMVALFVRRNCLPPQTRQRIANGGLTPDKTGLESISKLDRLENILGIGGNYK